MARWWNDGVWDLVVGRDAFFPSCFRETWVFVTALLAVPDELECTDFKAFEGDSESFVWFSRCTLETLTLKLGDNSGLVLDFLPRNTSTGDRCFVPH